MSAIYKTFVLNFKKRDLLEYILQHLIFSMQFITGSSIQTSYIITKVTRAPSLLVKGTFDIFIVANAPLVWMISRFATFSIFNVVKIVAITSVQALEKITRGTCAPTLVTKIWKKILSIIL